MCFLFLSKESDAEKLNRPTTILLISFQSPLPLTKMSNIVEIVKDSWSCEVSTGPDWTGGHWLREQRRGWEEDLKKIWRSELRRSSDLGVCSARWWRSCVGECHLLRQQLLFFLSYWQCYLTSPLNTDQYKTCYPEQKPVQATVGADMVTEFPPLGLIKYMLS